MINNTSQCLKLPYRLRANVLSFEQTNRYWDVLDGKANDKKIILSSVIQRNIINILPGYHPKRLDCVQTNKQTRAAYFKPKLEECFLCINDLGLEYWLSGDMIGLIATIKAFKTYAHKKNDLILEDMNDLLLSDLSLEFKRLVKERQRGTLSKYDKHLDVRKVHDALQHWLK